MKTNYFTPAVFFFETLTNQPSPEVSHEETRVVDPDTYVFWAFRIRIRHHLYGSGSGSFHQQAKTVKKTLISNILLLLFNFLSLKTDVNVPSKRNWQKKFVKNLFLLASCHLLTKKAGFGSESKCHRSTILEEPYVSSCVLLFICLIYADTLYVCVDCLQ